MQNSAIIAECEAGWVFDHCKALSEFVSGSSFGCPNDLFKIKQPYFQSAASVVESKTATGLEESSNKKKRKILKQSACQDEADPNDYHAQVKLQIAKPVNELIEIARQQGHFMLSDDITKGDKGRSLSEQDLIDYCALVDLAKSYFSARSMGEKIILKDGDTTVPDIVAKIVQNSMKFPLIIEALNAKYIIPSRSTFLLSDIDEINLLLDAGKTYDLIVADPPWHNKSVKRSRRYDSLSFYKIKSLPVPKLASNGALVIVWVTNKKKIINFVKEELFPSWNVELVADWHWVKLTTKGEYVFDLDSLHKKPYEPIIIGRFHKDKVTHLEQTAGDVPKGSNWQMDLPSHKVICSVPCTLHSRKPPLNEILLPFLPDDPECLELFARSLVPGWTSWGNEVLKYQNTVYFEKVEDDNEV
eukprot:Seg2698.1 transcript_id=Seg2698.1/GoldUCD/mRNA.D3Y31 product="Methyltransferase-like protein 4" protein_id=Seg2698.1/GoldUCD/D3Y31